MNPQYSAATLHKTVTERKNGCQIAVATTQIPYESTNTEQPDRNTGLRIHQTEDKFLSTQDYFLWTSEKRLRGCKIVTQPIKRLFGSSTKIVIDKVTVFTNYLYDIFCQKHGCELTRL